MTFAQQNIKSSLEQAEKLVQAKDVEEMMRLRADYIKRQARELGEGAGTTTWDASKAGA